MVKVEEIKSDDSKEIRDTQESIPRICLNMIVKDEEHCILETLENVYKYVDYYIIVDTGSTDNTKKVIKEFMDSKGLKGEIHDSEFRDFGYARSKALSYCSQKCRYAWVIDADDLVQGDFKFPEKMTADGYNVQYGKGFVYWRCQIFRMDKPGPDGAPAWKYNGVLHEYPHCTKRNTSIAYMKGNYFIESRRKGARNKVKDKYQKDAAVFEEALKKGDVKDESRYIFYLAQSYFDAGDFTKSLENYRKRVQMGGWVEEVYYSQYRVAICMARLGRSFLDIINEFIRATQIHPGRAEPFYEVARIFRMQKMYRHAYEYGKLGLPLMYNESYLFCTKAVFDYLLMDEVAISAYYVGDYATATNLSTRLLSNPETPSQFHLRININRQFANQKIQDVGPKEKPLLVFYTGYSTIYSNKEIYGSELALQSLTKYLQQDYRIVVFSENCELQGIINGVMSLPARNFEQFQAVNEIDVMVISRYICFFMEHKLRAKKTFVWIHDTTFQPYWNGMRMRNEGRYLMQNMDSQIDGYITLTEWHRKLVSQHYGIEPHKIHIIGNGLRPELFEQKTEKIPQRFIYTSCPKRGLTLLLKYFQKIHEEFDNAELYIFRGKESFTKEQLDTIDKLPYVYYEGGVPQSRTAVEFQKADVWFYPTNFPETYCMTALEAQMAGCICIATDFAALSETVNNRGVLCKEVYASEEYEEFMLQKVRDALNGKLEDLRAKGKEWASQQTWEMMSKKWRGLFQTGMVVAKDARKVETPGDLQLAKLIKEGKVRILNEDEVKRSMISSSRLTRGSTGDVKDVKNVKAPENVRYPKIPIVVVNLDRRKDRWAEFERRAKNIRLEKYERFSAIDGKKLDITDESVTKLFPLDVSTERKMYESHRHQPGVLGCAMSHYKIWKKMLEETKSKSDTWLVLEDDVEFTPEFASKWPQLWEQLRHDTRWDILYLGYTDHQYNYGDMEVIPGVRQFRGNVDRKHGGGTFGYCIRRSAAEYYVKLIESEGVYRAIDWFMIDQFSKLTCYLTLPVMVTSEPWHPQRNPDSDVRT